VGGGRVFGGARTASVHEHEDPELKLVRRRHSGLKFTLRIAASLPMFALAVVFAVRSWNPIGNGYLTRNDNPDGQYFTVAATGVAIAAMFAAAGLLIAWPRFRRYGGFFLLAAAAAAASVLPYLLFHWDHVPKTWPWAYFIQNLIGWLRFAPRPRSTGITIQIGLAIVVAVAVAAQLLYWWRPIRGRRDRSRRSLIARRHADPSP
jgi:hypothetical protein